jgi:hypothetical protein
VIEIAIGAEKRNWSFGRFQVCGRDHLGSSSRDSAVAREPISDNESNATSIALPSDTLQHQRIRMKLAKSLLIFAKVSMTLDSPAQHRSDANGSARLTRRKITHICRVKLTVRGVHNETVAKSQATLMSEPSGGDGSQPSLNCSFARSMNLAAWRRSSVPIIVAGSKSSRPRSHRHHAVALRRRTNGNRCRSQQLSVCIFGYRRDAEATGVFPSACSRPISRRGQAQSSARPAGGASGSPLTSVRAASASIAAGRDPGPPSN